MVLVYILAGVIVLTALSVLGIAIERREKRRFEMDDFLLLSSNERVIATIRKMKAP